MKTTVMMDGLLGTGSAGCCESDRRRRAPFIASARRRLAAGIGADEVNLVNQARILLRQIARAMGRPT